MNAPRKDPHRVRSYDPSRGVVSASLSPGVNIDTIHYRTGTARERRRSTPEARRAWEFLNDRSRA